MATGSKGKSPLGFVKEERESDDGSTTTNNNNNTTMTDEEKSSRGSSLTSVARDDESPATAAQNKVGEQETLREQLQKLVSHKLTTLGGELDHAGLVALETLAKLPPAAGVDSKPSSSAAAAAAAGGGGGGGADRPRRILPPGLEKVKKFSGKDPHGVTDTLNQFHSLVVAALPGASPGTVNKALNRDVVFVLEGSALTFFNSLKAGQIEWEPTLPGPDAASAEGAQQQQQQQQRQQEGPGGNTCFRPPSTWAELCEAFHDHYLPVAGIARTSEKLFSLSQAPGESVPSLAQRQLGLGKHINRLIDANGGQTTFWEAITIRLFERALRADLQRLQEAEPPCSTFQESVDRAERNATNIAGKGDDGGLKHGQKRDSSGAVVAEGNGASSADNKGPIAVPAARDGVAASEGGVGGGGGGGAAAAFSRTLPKHFMKISHDDSDRNGQDVPSSTAAGHGKHAVRKGGDGGNRGEAASEDGGGGGGAVAAFSRVLPKHFMKESHDDSEINGQDVPSSVAASGHRIHPTRKGGDSGNRGEATSEDGDGGDGGNRGEFSATTLSDDAGQAAGDTSPDDRPRFAFRRHNEPDRGGGAGRGNGGGGFGEDHSRVSGNRNKWSVKRGGKRVRDWQENHHTGGANQPFPPHQRPRQGNPADAPPCTIPQCKTINRQFHCSNDCFFHPVRGQRNMERSGRGRNNRPPPFRQNTLADPTNGRNIVYWGTPHGNGPGGNQFYKRN